MEKFAKWYLTAEGVIMTGIILSGFYDPSFFLFGIMFFGVIASFFGAIISWVWCRKRLHSGGLVKWPHTIAVANAIFFICAVIFILTIFGGGIGFLM